MARYRKKPVEIDAVRWTGDNFPEIAVFLAGEPGVVEDPDAHSLLVHTPEGRMRCVAGDWLIRGVHGELYLCRDEFFHQTYEAVDVQQDV